MDLTITIKNMKVKKGGKFWYVHISEHIFIRVYGEKARQRLGYRGGTRIYLLLKIVVYLPSEWYAK